MTKKTEQSSVPERENSEDLFAAYMQHGEDYLASGKPIEAKICFKKALIIKPDNSSPWFKVGIIHYRLDEDEKAIGALLRANSLAPNDTTILNALGAAYGRSGQLKEAIDSFVEVCRLEPDHAGAAMNCGRILFSLGRFDHAEAWLNRAATVRPGHAKTLTLLTQVRLALGQPRLAVMSGEDAVRADPEHYEARLPLGQAHLSVRDLRSAYEHLTLFLKHNPDHPEALYNLAETEEKSGKSEDAKDLYRRVAELDIDTEFRTLTRLKIALTLPVVCKSAAEIAQNRNAIIEALENVPREPVRDIYSAGGFTNFYLAYHGKNDRGLQERVAAFYLECSPDLAARAPHVGQAPKRDKIRIGILSSFLRSHTVGYLCAGLIEYLDRDRFEVVLLRCPVLPVDDPVAPVLANMADRVIDLPDDLRRAREIIASEEADLIYFPEIGMDKLVYFLAFARSAPVQVMGWGHPVTSGIPNIDAFLSVAGMEPEKANEHYSEDLIELDGLSICVTEPIIPTAPPDRAAFGIDPKAPAYLCAQSLYKIHPAYDSIIADLLEKDTNALIYFVTIHTAADDIFLRRLEKTAGSHIGRIKILPRVKSRDFTSLLSCADVLLDIPHWSGGKTSLESLRTGTPIVHWPGEFMRGRHTLAFYKRMDVMDCVVDSAEAYVETAYRLVHDQIFRTSVRQRIWEKAHLLFNDSSAISEISGVFEQMVLESRQTKTKQN
ncbi:MAG: tetratricopeptide repeat protein [Rhodospirillaceae bacterium]|nr:tetratricopeptide repeat protein [Rhodospirillaceae bacterium]